MGKIKYIILLIIVLFYTKDLVAQRNGIIPRNFYINANIQRGSIIKHSPKITPLIKDNTLTTDISISFPTEGNKDWQFFFRYPQTGLGINTIRFGNKDILGSAVGLYYYLNVPIIMNNHFSFNYQLGMGLSYFNKYYHPEKNPENVVISYPINILLNVGFDLRINIYKDLYATVGIDTWHYSNGRIKTPNIGINSLSYSAGLSYFVNRDIRKKVKNDFPKFKGFNEFSIIHAFGIKEIYPPGGRKYYASSLIITYERHISYKRRAGLGIDVFYDSSLPDEIISIYPDSTGIRNTDLVSFGIHISQDFIIDKFSFTTQVGRYLKHNYEKVSRVYMRYGLKYHFSKHFFANLTLKVHLIAKADFLNLEWAIVFLNSLIT